MEAMVFLTKVLLWKILKTIELCGHGQHFIHWDFHSVNTTLKGNPSYQNIGTPEGCPLAKAHISYNYPIYFQLS